jgi:hypothetical protein
VATREEIHVGHLGSHWRNLRNRGGKFALREKAIHSAKGRFVDNRMKQAGPGPHFVAQSKPPLTPSQSDSGKQLLRQQTSVTDMTILGRFCAKIAVKRFWQTKCGWKKKHHDGGISTPWRPGAPAPT